MKCFIVINVTDGGRAASNLHFLERSDAVAYQKMLLWPFANLGFMHLDDGSKIRLQDVQFRVETQILPGLYDAALDWVLWMKEKQLGFSPVVPGRCFDPADWRAVSDHELRDPIIAPLIAGAQRLLDEHPFG